MNFDEERAAVFSRTFTCIEEKCTINIYIPTLSPDGNYSCVYEVIASGRTITREASGIDAIQAFLLALMQTGSLLYSGRLIDATGAFWLSPDEMGYLGLPIPVEDQGMIPNGPKLIMAI